MSEMFGKLNGMKEIINGNYLPMAGVLEALGIFSLLCVSEHKNKKSYLSLLLCLL